MGRIIREDPEKKKVVFPVADHQRLPKSTDPFADYIASMSYVQTLRKDRENKQLNQNHNPPTSSRAPHSTIGSANGGGRGPNTTTGSANGGGRAPNTNISSANGGSRGPNTTTGSANGGGRAPNTNISSANGGSISVNTPPSSSSSSLIQLHFGKLKYDPSLFNTSHIKFPSNPPQITSFSSSSSSSSEAARISSSDILKLQHLIKLAIDTGRLRSKCRKCGNSIQHCCEQTILEAVSSLPPPPSNS
ncbi:sericin-2-like [Tripterygium wilfordii]|uniref:sericin-2-like n=1 Tax=Tripterygium wilfordii TaxID=458696 RepID=UPI0018F83035|nr:sericin-2-like [Tripterygium wilfordii]